MNEEKKYPKVTVGAMILNKAGKFLLVRSSKWQDKLVCTGGHVEWGETIESAIKREVKEETNLNVFNPQFLKASEFILSDDYVKDRHIIALDYAVETNNSEDDVKLEEREASESLWLTPEEVLSRDDVHPSIKELIIIYREKIEGNKKLEEYKIGWQRAIADYQNLQKEVSARRAELVQMSEQQILDEFIPVYSNFKKAFNSAQGETSKEQANWVMGIKYIMKQFQDILKGHGVEEVKTVGERFDPRLHETAGEEESDKEHGVILREVDGGYTMGGRVIKVAKVIIAK